MITICEECFPDGKNHEMYSTVPLGPCSECGKYDQRPNGVISHLFPNDPRKKDKMKEINNLNKELNLLLKAVHEYQQKHRDNADAQLLNRVTDYCLHARKMLEEA